MAGVPRGWIREPEWGSLQKEDKGDDTETNQGKLLRRKDTKKSIADEPYLFFSGNPRGEISCVGAGRA